MNRLEQIAQFMLDQHNSKQNYENLPETLMPKDFDEASSKSLGINVSGKFS